MYQAMSVEKELRNPCDEEMNELGTVADKSMSSKELRADKSLEKCVPESDALSIDITVPCSLFKMDQKRENRLDDSNCYTFFKQTRILLWLEIVSLISICIAVAGGFTVPIIIAANTDRENNFTLSSDHLDSCVNRATQVCK